MQLTAQQLSLLKNKSNGIKNIDPQEARKIRRTCLKEYIQSYVNWLYAQNEDFSNTLTHEEIVNYFLNELRHPLWFRLFLKADSFNLIVRVDLEIRKYIAHPYELEGSYFIFINPIKDGDYSNLELNKTFHQASVQQIVYIKQICSRFKLGLQPWDLNNITTQDYKYFCAVTSYAYSLSQKGEC